MLNGRKMVHVVTTTEQKKFLSLKVNVLSFFFAASGYSRGDFDTQVSYLQEQINALAASNEALNNQVYYTGDTDSLNYANNLISST